MRPQVAINQRIADRLLTEKRITRETHERAVVHATRHRVRIEDALIELEIMSEGDLLKYIATVHSTRFVSTDKLSKAVIEPRVVAKISRKTADLHGVFPVMFDETTKTLSVVTADPDNDAALHELKLSAGVKEVKALVARPSAVRAAIAKTYHGDKNAFASFNRQLDSIAELMNDNPFERALKPPSAPPPVLEAPPRPVAPASTPVAPRSLPAPAPALPAPVPVAAPAVLTPPHPVVAALPATASAEFLEALNVLVSLLENARPDLRGHSSMVARIIKKTCERIGLGAGPIAAFTAAGYLHDLGKFGAYHLTPLNVSEYEGHRVAAQKLVEVPVHLMEMVGLDKDTVAAISNMYERYDGKGFPDGQSGKEIPLGARVLSIADAYADLTQNPRNPYRKILRPAEACEVLAQHRGTIFDPNIVDLLRQSMTGDDMRAKLLADRHQVLIVDPDPEETTVLELRMIEQGFEVKIARNAQQARRELETGEINVVVSEIDFDEPEAGLVLRAEARGEAWGRDVTWVVLTSKADRQTAQKAFDLGVDDFMSKPASTDIFVAKLRQLIERRASRSGGQRGVSGSLAEMGLPDMVQILWHGRKTCALKIQSQSSSGEIHFSEGQIVNARWDAIQGEDAFYKMLNLQQGDFRLDPNFTPTARSINASPEALLLEGMRRLDEAAFGGH